MRSSQERGQGGPQALYLAPSMGVQLITARGRAPGGSQVCGSLQCPASSLLASPECPLQLSHLYSSTSTIVPGRPPPGSEALC